MWTERSLHCRGQDGRHKHKKRTCQTLKQVTRMLATHQATKTECSNVKLCSED